MFSQNFVKTKDDKHHIMVKMKKNIVNLFKNKFIRGGFLLTVTNFLVGFLNYLFSSFTGKLLGPSGYGEIAALFSYLAILSVPMQVITTDLIRRLGEKGSMRLTVLKSWEVWFWNKVLCWKYLLIPYFLTLFFLPKLTNLSLLFSLTLLLLLLISFASTIYTGSLQGAHLFFWFSAISIIATLIKLLGPIFVYFRIGGLTTIVTFLLLSSSSIVFFGKFLFQRLVKSQTSVRHLTEKVIQKRIIPLIFNKSILIIALSTLSFILFNNLDVIFVKKFFSAETAGIYSVWNLFSKFVFYLSAPLTGLSFIFFSDRDSAKLHRKILSLTVIFFVFGGAALFGLYSFFGRFLLLLIFNEKYLFILPYLPKAAIFGSLYTLLSILNGFFVAKNSFYSLIITVAIIFYGVSLFLFGKTIESIININIFFSSLAVLTYFLLSLRRNRYF